MEQSNSMIIILFALPNCLCVCLMQCNVYVHMCNKWNANDSYDAYHLYIAYIFERTRACAEPLRFDVLPYVQCGRLSRRHFSGQSFVAFLEDKSACNLFYKTVRTYEINSNGTAVGDSFLAFAREYDDHCFRFADGGRIWWFQQTVEYTLCIMSFVLCYISLFITFLSPCPKMMCLRLFYYMTNLQIFSQTIILSSITYGSETMEKTNIHRLKSNWAQFFFGQFQHSRVHDFAGGVVRYCWLLLLLLLIAIFIPAPTAVKYFR